VDNWGLVDNAATSAEASTQKLENNSTPQK